MTKVDLTPDRTKMLIVVYRDGKAPHKDRFDPASAAARRKLAKEWGIGMDTFNEWCEAARVHGSTKTFEVAAPPAAGAGKFYVRAMTDPRDSATVHDLTASRFVKEILPAVPVTSVAEWEGLESLCCLDVDYHDATPPHREWLENVVRTRVSPRPLAWHFSRGGGLHLFYAEAGAFAADELAAAAALRFRSIDGAAGLELKSVVRGPGGAIVHHDSEQDTGTEFLQWLGSADHSDEERTAWLDSEGMECGQRYDHDRCPIDPTADPGASRQPVLVSEAGIYCFRCSGKGLTYGSRRPGWAPWAAILGSPSAGELGALIRNCVHWGHARYVLTERYGLPEPFARLAYKAALRAYHCGKPSEALCNPAVIFHKDTLDVQRVNDAWVNIVASHQYVKGVEPILRCLPAALVPTDEGLKVSESAVAVLSQAMPLDSRGYQNIQVVHGFKLAGQFLADRQRETCVAVVNPVLRGFSSRHLPRYVPPGKRMNVDAAWALVETVLPRIDRKYITALIVGFGCSQETQSGLLPIIFASGPSSVGKTAMAQAAAGIVGARIGAEATYDSDTNKFRQGIKQGGAQGPVVVLNELIKDATRGRYKLSVREALDFVLNLTPNSSSHQLYAGPAKMGRLPTLVITDTACPPDLRDETQLARRIRHIYINGRKEEWKRTIANAGLTDLHLIRTVSEQMAKACDAIVSDIVDTYFSLPATWDDLADMVGVKTIEDSDDDFEDPTPWLRELFRLVCAAPDLSPRDKKVYSHGYKKVCRSTPGAEEEDPLAQAYAMFTDGGNDWAKPRRLQEKDWAGILKVGDTVRLDLRGDVNGVYLRFRVGPVKKPEKVNEQIIDPKDWEPRL